ncbi:MAG TPA: kelch repeat-containing protein [Tepidisphaeraceae bacterium]|nr:kelch repeat-containing protein [Tepidisphaeraceae bacterium]
MIETLEGRQLLHGGHEHLNTPYFGTPFAVGATPVTIEAEHYDFGGQGIAYHDTTDANTWGQYRTGTDAGVDLRQFATGQYRISDAYEGEWVLYSISVQEAGTYTLDLRISNADPNAKLHVEVDGQDVTGAVTVPDTNNFNTLTTVSRTITLSAGQSVLKLSFDVGAGPTRSVAGVDWLRLTLDQPAPSVPPAAPSGADAAALSATQVRLRWVDNADNETGHRIYRKQGAGGTWALIDTLSAGETEFLDNALSPGTNYVYRVAAFNAFGQSAFSNEDDATTHASDPGGTTITWQAVAPSPINRAESNGAVVNGKLYVFGGLYVQSGKILATTRCDVYDPATDTWTRISDCPDKVTHSGIVVVGDTIWLIAGYFGDHPGPAGKKVLKYNTTTNTWSRGPNLPYSRGAGGAALLNNRIHFFGGMGYDRTWESSSHWVLDLGNQSAGWKSKAPLPNPRNHTSGAAINGFVYCIGGQHGQEENQVAQRDVHRYDPSTDTWTKVAELPTVRSHVNASTFIMNGKIVILGGETGYDQPLRNVTVFDPLTNTTYEMSPLPEKRSTSVAGVLPDGRIITATGNTPMPSAHTYIGRIS